MVGRVRELSGVSFTRASIQLWRPIPFQMATAKCCTAGIQFPHRDVGGDTKQPGMRRRGAGREDSELCCRCADSLTDLAGRPEAQPPWLANMVGRCRLPQEGHGLGPGSLCERGRLCRSWQLGSKSFLEGRSAQPVPCPPQSESGDSKSRQKQS